MSAWQVGPVDDLFRLSNAVRRDPRVDAWFTQGDAVRLTVRPWLEALRACGEDVRELIHDGRPTVCVGDAAFAYVDAFKAHAAIGFFHGAALDDPGGLLQGAGKRMRHVKLPWGRPYDAEALRRMVGEAYRDVRLRLRGDG